MHDELVFIDEACSCDLTRGQAADLIDKGTNSFFVVGSDGSRSTVITGKTAGGHSYLTTTPDSSLADNRLSLPQFP